MVRHCIEEENTTEIDQSRFWDDNGIHWDAHRIGWTVAGCCAVATVIITAFSVSMHCKHFNVKNEQRNIIRILLLPAFYAIISFCSYRYFRSSIYFTVCLNIWESISMVSFLYLLIQYIGNTPQDQRDFLEQKGKSALPMVRTCQMRSTSLTYIIVQMGAF